MRLTPPRCLSTYLQMRARKALTMSRESFSYSRSRIGGCRLCSPTHHKGYKVESHQQNCLQYKECVVCDLRSCSDSSFDVAQSGIAYVVGSWSFAYFCACFYAYSCACSTDIATSSSTEGIMKGKPTVHAKQLAKIRRKLLVESYSVM